MSEFQVKLPDVGEGVAEAELVSWAVAVGDEVTSDSTLAEVMTDKATVEVACPVDGTVTELRGEPGDTLAVGSVIVVISREQDEPVPTRSPEPETAPREHQEPGPTRSDLSPREQDEPVPKRSLAAPAVRERARTLGIDLATVTGSGPDGRVVHADLDRLLAGGAVQSTAGPSAGADRVEPVRGLRRRIAQRLSASWSEIPHITYVEAVDVTELEVVRSTFNAQDDNAPRLTILPFVVRAIVLACREQPRLNATYDSSNEELTIHGSVNVGIATQTDDGLVVTVLRDAGSRRVSECAAEIARLADAARASTASREELSGSTITITSLGALGGVVTTPLINAPEVAIIGINKIEIRPVWRDGAFQPRQMMNLSSSFDHRIVDGWDAATFIQRIKQLLEVPALLFSDAG